MDDTQQTERLDLGPAAAALAGVVAGIRDDQLDDPTPCPAYSVADLVDHVAGLTVAFAAAARKQELPTGASGPSADGSRLEPGWRERIGAGLDDLAQAWREPTAHDGLTMAGPIEMPAEIAVLVALDEVVVHGWDLARATGQEYDAGPAALAACLGFAESFEAPADGDGPGLFGPPVPTDPGAPLVDRLAGATGRDPAWTP